MKDDHTRRVWVAHNQRLTEFKPYFCESCHFCFTTVSELKYHFEAKYCEFNQSSPYSVIHRIKKPISMAPHVARLPKTDLEKAANFNLVKKVPKQKRTVQTVVDDDKGLIACMFCEREFTEVTFMLTHLRQLHGIGAWLQYKGKTLILHFDTYLSSESRCMAGELSKSI